MSFSYNSVLRGIHFQSENQQGKLVSVIEGMVFDVAVDLRKNSKTFGKWAYEILDSEKHNMLWIPPGLGHGFLVLSNYAKVYYKCTDFYNPKSEKCSIISLK